MWIREVKAKLQSFCRYIDPYREQSCFSFIKFHVVLYWGMGLLCILEETYSFALFEQSYLGRSPHPPHVLWNPYQWILCFSLCLNLLLSSSLYFSTLFVSNFSLNFRTIYLFIVYYLILHVNGIRAMGREIGFILELHLS